MVTDALHCNMVKKTAARFTLPTPLDLLARRALWVLVVCALVASCSQAPSGARGQVLVAWHTLNGLKEQALLNLVDEWNRTNPYNITVVPERHDPTTLNSSVQQGIAQRALPALMLVSTVQAASYYRQGILTPLDRFITDSSGGNYPGSGWDASDRADLYPFILTAGVTSNGETVGIPFGGIVRLVYYNRDWLKPIGLDNSPATWDQFNTACGSATDRTKGTLCFGVDPSATTFEQWLLAFGGQVTTDNLNVLQIATPAALDAMNHLSDYVRSNQAYRVTTSSQSRDDFASSRVLFMFGWSDQLGAVSADIKQRGDFDWGVGLLPAIEGRPQTTNLRAPLWVIARTPGVQNLDREQAAWLFLHWLLDKSQTAQWAAQTGELPARASALQELLAMNGSTAGTILTPNETTVLKTVAPLARPEPLVSGWACVQNTLSDAMRLVFDGQPVTDTLQLAQAKAQAQLNTDCSPQ